MGVEIERKFLVKRPAFAAAASGIVPVRMVQGYLQSSARLSVRVRVAGEHAFLTVKGPVKGFSRSEYEYEIPRPDAERMLAELCGAVVEKNRYHVQFAGRLWEVDVFEGANAGLAVAEIELESEDAQFELPDFAGEEVTGVRRYYNGALAERPFSSWGCGEDSPPRRQ